MARRRSTRSSTWRPERASVCDRSRRSSSSDRAQTEAPQGVLARADPIDPTSSTSCSAEPDAFLVALDGVTDPQNLGAVLRVAETAGVTGVVLPRHRSARPHAGRGEGRGGRDRAPADRDRRRGCRPCSTGRRGPGCGRSVSTPTGRRTSSHSTWPTDRSSSCSARKAAGLSRLTRERCDLVAGIPMRGADREPQRRDRGRGRMSRDRASTARYVGDRRSNLACVAGVAQSAEQRFCKPQVIGSIPISGSHLLFAQVPPVLIPEPIGSRGQDRPPIGASRS